MRTFVAIVFGFLSAVMLFLLAATLIGYTISAEFPTLAVVFVALLAGCGISAYYLVQRMQYGKSQAGYTSSLFELVGFSGALIAGYISDRLLNGRLGPAAMA
jgi:hypothetical protein